MRKADPLDPSCSPAPVLSFPVYSGAFRGLNSHWYTEKEKIGSDLEDEFKFKKISYEVIRTEEEDRAIAAAELKRKEDLQAKLAGKLKAAQQAQAAKAAAAAAGKAAKRAKAARLVQEQEWVDPVSRQGRVLSSLLQSPPPLALRAALTESGTNYSLERLPSPVRDVARSRAATVPVPGKWIGDTLELASTLSQDALSASLSQLLASSSTSRDDVYSKAKALHSSRRHAPQTIPRHRSLDPRPLKLGSYNAGETTKLSKRDKAVLGVVVASRKEKHKPTSQVFLHAAEKALFDVSYSRHIVQAQELKERQRYVTLAEREAIRLARRKPKEDDWRSIRAPSAPVATPNTSSNIWGKN